MFQRSNVLTFKRFSINRGSLHYVVSHTLVQVQRTGSVFCVNTKGGLLHATLTKGMQTQGDQHFRQALPPPWAPHADVLRVATLPAIHLILVFIDEAQHHACYLVTLPGDAPQVGVEIGVIYHTLEILPRVGDISPMVAERFIRSLPNPALVRRLDGSHFNARG